MSTIVAPIERQLEAAVPVRVDRERDQHPGEADSPAKSWRVTS